MILNLCHYWDNPLLTPDLAKFRTTIVLLNHRIEVWNFLMWKKIKEAKDSWSCNNIWRWMDDIFRDGPEKENDQTQGFPWQQCSWENLISRPGWVDGDNTCPPSCTRTEVWFLATTVRMEKEEEGRSRRRIREVILIRIRIKYQQSPWLAWITRSFLRIHQVGGGSESSFWRRSIETQVTLAFCFWSPDLRGVWGRVCSRISRSCGREADGQLWKKNAMFDRLGKQGVKGWILGLGTTCCPSPEMLSLPVKEAVGVSQAVWQWLQCNTFWQHCLATLSGSATF